MFIEILLNLSMLGVEKLRPKTHADSLNPKQWILDLPFDSSGPWRALILRRKNRSQPEHPTASLYASLMKNQSITVGILFGMKGLARFAYPISQ